MDGELHRNDRIGWLRAATLGANDGLISTSSLVVGVPSAEPTQATVLLAAVAGLVAGALSGDRTAGDERPGFCVASRGGVRRTSLLKGTPCPA